MLGDGMDDRIAELLASLVPVALLQIVGSVLHKAGHDVTTGGRDRRVRQTWNDDVYIRTAREAPVLGIVVSALHVFDRRRDRDRAAQVRPWPRQTGKVRQARQRQIDLARRPAKL